MSDTRTVVDGEVTVIVKKPGKKEINDSQIVYNKVMRESLENKALLRAKLNSYLEEQGIWDKEKEAKYQKYISDINSKEMLLKKGGIPLKKAKAIALDLKRLRNDFRDLISERTAYDGTTAEGVADNARFDYLVSVCVLNPSTQRPVFKSVEDYNAQSSEVWAVKAAAELANFIYGLDPEYENSLEENKFLKRFHFVDENGRYVNRDGHLIAIDENGQERLINEKNEYVAYDENGEQYRVDRDGNRYIPDDQIVQAAFLDDDGNPVDEDVNSSEEEPADKKPKKKKVTTAE